MQFRGKEENHLEKRGKDLMVGKAQTLPIFQGGMNESGRSWRIYLSNKVTTFINSGRKYVGSNIPGVGSSHKTML